MLQHEQKVVTPTGTAIFPHLVTPDNYEGSLAYKVSLKLDPAANGVQELLASITAAAEEELKRGKAALKKKGGKHAATAKELALQLPFEPEYDDNGDETGLVILKAKSKAAGITDKGKEWERKIPLFDAKRKKIPHGSVDIWSGSRLNVELVTNCYTAPGLKIAGVSFYIHAVQVISLAGGFDGSDGSGFGVEEGGFDGPELEEQSASTIPETESGLAAPDDSSDY